MLFETKYVQISAMFEDYYYYANHFVTLKQLFISNFWGNGGSVLGSGDGMSFSVGYLHWIIPAIGILIAFYLLLKKPKQYLRLIMPFLLLSFLGFFATFMATHGSTFIWEIFKIRQEIQFPWRFLNMANFFFSASIVFLVLLFQKFKINRLTSIIALGFIVIALILINYKHFYPITSYSLTDQQWFNDSWTLQKRGTIDYLPATALGYPKHPAQDYVDAIIPTTVIYKISNASKGSDWISFNLELSDNATITLPVLAFPGFKLLDFGEEISYMIETSSGRIIVNLSAGSHVLYLKLYNTPIRALSDYWSLLAWILIFFFFVKNSWKKLSSRKILKTTVV
jgi:hypothetical protein